MSSSYAAVEQHQQADPTASPRPGSAVSSQRDGNHRGEPLRIAFPVLDDSFWTSGALHVSSLISALRETYGQEIGLFSFRPSGAGPARALDAAVELDGTVPYTYPTRWSLTWADNWLSRHIRRRDVSIQRVMERHGIDVAVCTRLSSDYGRVATLWTITDFQHLKLPE